MFIRTIPEKQTLTSIRDELDTHTETVTCSTADFKLKFAEEGGTVGFGDKKKFEAPASWDTKTALGNLLKVPTAFLGRLEYDMQQKLIQHLLEKNPGHVAVRFGDWGIEEIYDPKHFVVDPRDLVDAAMRIIDPKAPVVEFWNYSGQEFKCDVIVPANFDEGIGGVKPRKGTKQVGDITRGGIRFGVDHKHHLVPWVSQYLFRLICTNGQECRDPGWKIDGRGRTREQVLDDFESIADAAFHSVEASIAAHYDLRNTKVPNPERMLLRLSREYKLPVEIERRLVSEASGEDMPDNASMFDVVNLITNQANDPSISGKAGVRRRFECMGGSIVSEHVARCRHCQAKLN